MIARGISSTVPAALMGHESSAITERRYIVLVWASSWIERVGSLLQADGAIDE
jgi:hypothetical protein